MAKGTGKPKGALVAALVCFVLSVAGCGFAAVSGGSLVLDMFSWLADVVDDLQPTAMGDEVSFTADSDRSAALVSVETTCTGSGPDGDVRFDSYETFGSTTDVSSGGEDFSGYISFDSAEGASYRITCGDVGQGSFAVLAEPGFLDDLDKLGRAGISVLAGVVLFLIAIILLIVGLVQRSSWKKRNQGPPQAAYAGVASVPPAPGAPVGQVQPPPGQVPPPPPTLPQPPPSQVPPPQQQGWGEPTQPQAPADPPPFGGRDTPPPPPPPPSPPSPPPPQG